MYTYNTIAGFPVGCRGRERKGRGGGERETEREREREREREGEKGGRGREVTRKVTICFITQLQK
jgi:hypothetical protein